MGIKLWERDFDIMLALARNGFMRIEQIQRMRKNNGEKWFPSYWSCIKRLEKLKEDKYIDVTYIERNGSGIYYLQKDGISLINGYYGTQYKHYAKSTKILHNISCSEFYINLPKEYALLDYEIEFFLEEFIPDIYFVYRNNAREIDCLVEIDNLGRPSRFLPKVKKYNDFLTSRKWKEYFGDSFPRCIIVSNSKGLENRLKEISKIPFKIIGFDNLKGGLKKCLD